MNAAGPATSRAVFLSHSSADADAARAVCADLEGRGIACWIAPRNIDQGHNYARQIVEAVRNCKVMLVLVSSAANASEHVEREIEQAARSRKRLLPVRIEQIPPSAAIGYYVDNVQWVDAIGGGIESHLDKIAVGVAKVLDMPPPPKLDWRKRLARNRRKLLLSGFIALLSIVALTAVLRGPIERWLGWGDWPLDPNRAVKLVIERIHQNGERRELSIDDSDIREDDELRLRPTQPPGRFAYQLSIGGDNKPSVVPWEKGGRKSMDSPIPGEWRWTPGPPKQELLLLLVSAAPLDKLEEQKELESAIAALGLPSELHPDQQIVWSGHRWKAVQKPASTGVDRAVDRTWPDRLAALLKGRKIEFDGRMFPVGPARPK